MDDNKINVLINENMKFDSIILPHVDIEVNSHKFTGFEVGSSDSYFDD